MEQEDHYRTVSGESEGFYKEKGSKFLSFAYPAESEEVVKEQLALLRKQYYDARHFCYAFVLKPEEGREESYRANDDGEPAHSAGDPILGQIRSYGLHDVLVVVIRYFGGTKLGVSGLINAYKTASAQALANNKVVEKTVRKSFGIRFSYEATSEVMHTIDRYQLQIVLQEFTADCYYMLSATRSQAAHVKNELATIRGVSLIKH